MMLIMLIMLIMLMLMLMLMLIMLMVVSSRSFLDFTTVAEVCHWYHAVESSLARIYASHYENGC